jgi:hypothetical protein
MIANISWNAAKASTGIRSPSAPVTASNVPRSPQAPEPPIRPPEVSVVNERLKPYATQSRLTTAMVAKFIISMFSTLLLRTSPP